MARVADYEFGGASGSTSVSDSTAGALHGTTSGGASVSGAGELLLDGSNDHAVVAADPALGLSQGTIIIEFTQDTASTGDLPYGSTPAQTLFSVDSRGYGDGGHLTIYIDSDGEVWVRHQSDTESFYQSGGSITPGTPASIGYSWGPDGTSLVVNGVEVDSSSNVLELAGDQYPMVFGASQATSDGDSMNDLVGFFDGSISQVQIHDTPLSTDTPLPCFASDTRIATPRGEVAIRDLAAGDLVLTADNGPQPIREILHHRFNAADLALRPRLRPVRIAAGALGNTRALVVSRQHALLWPARDVLVRAIHLARYGNGRFRIAQGCRTIAYYHLLLERHEIVFAEGCGAETLLPGWDERTVAPPLPSQATARPILSGAEARGVLRAGAHEGLAATRALPERMPPAGIF